jgi:hypothetical protein
MTAPGAFVWLPGKGEAPARAVRFAIGDRSRRLVSGAWTVFADRHGVFRIAGTGGFGLTTLAIRRRGLAFSHASDGDIPFVGCGLMPDGRAARWIAAPDAPSWHAASLAFPCEFLRRTPRPAGDPVRRPMIQLPEPERGRMYRIAFLVTDSVSGRVDYEDRSDLYLGRVTDGRRRSLLILGRVVDSDLAALSHTLSRLSPEAPLRLHSHVRAPPAQERGLLLLTPGTGHLDIVELHNLHHPASVATGPRAAPARADQLQFPFGGT